MDRLPPELLSHIFVLAMPEKLSYRDTDVEETTNKPQTTLSLVCKYWNQVILETPQLWSYVYLGQKTTEYGLQRRLELSKGALLDVRIDTPVEYIARASESALRPLYDILVQTSDRWRTFILQGWVQNNSALKQWIPEYLPNVVEAGYLGRVVEDDEGSFVANTETGGTIETRFQPWTVAPKLRRFAVSAFGQFYFTGCPLVTEFAISDIAEWWGGLVATRSWHDKWEEYLITLAAMWPRLEVLEITIDLWDDTDDWHDTMAWTSKNTKWPPFHHLHTLKLNSCSEACTIPIITKMNAPNLRDIHVDSIHSCLPLPCPSITFPIDPLACRVHFANSTLRAIRTFLGSVSHLDQLAISINLKGTFGLRFRMTEKRGEVVADELARIMADCAWVTEHTRSVEWIVPDTIESFVGLRGELSDEAMLATRSVLSRLRSGNS
ncbi:hypothetical protein FRB90_008503 [Tulasnella sp. 427]|nr:hypothetical protein FRB90_008503 [Tulasnella sp. 427]